MPYFKAIEYVTASPILRFIAVFVALIYFFSAAYYFLPFFIGMGLLSTIIAVFSYITFLLSIALFGFYIGPWIGLSVVGSGITGFIVGIILTALTKMYSNKIRGRPYNAW